MCIRDRVGRTDIAQMMSNMTVRFVSGDGPVPPSWDSGTHPYAIGLSCGCAFPVELDFMPPPGVELTCPVHDADFEVLIVERLDLP